MFSLGRRFLALSGLALTAPLLAAQNAETQKEVDELIKSAQRHQTIGTLMAIAGIVIVAAAIPYYIWADRKKKARKLAQQGNNSRPKTPR